MLKTNKTEKNWLRFSSINNTLQLVNCSVELKTLDFKNLYKIQLNFVSRIVLDFIYHKKLSIYYYFSKHFVRFFIHCSKHSSYIKTKVNVNKKHK